ncbi:MAG: DUF1549 domain-containing protein, partial [Opitutaceae bacterium]
MIRRPGSLFTGALVGFVVLTAEAAPNPLPAVVEFNRHIRPIMSNSCFKCHGPDVKSNKSDLRLDLPDNATAPHKNARGRVTTPIVPGYPEKSEAWRRITTTDKGELMPPVDSLHELSARDKALIRRWIEQGAKYQPHWAYVAPKKAELPVVSGAAISNQSDPSTISNQSDPSNQSYSSNQSYRPNNSLITATPITDYSRSSPIDAFVRARLAEERLSPSPEADRRTLVRRVSLDLTGLPPTPAEVEAFVSDSRPGT